MFSLMNLPYASSRAGDKPPPDPLDELLDILIEEGGSVSTVYAHHTDEDMTLAQVNTFMKHEVDRWKVMVKEAQITV